MPEEYSSRKIHKEIVQNILTNATWAPSHGLTQPWRFKVFMEDGLKQLSEALPAMYKDFAPTEKFSQKKYDRFKERPLATSVIVAVSMKRDSEGIIPEIEEIEAVACAIQNMYLTCTAYGIGGFWSSPGFIYTDRMRDFLGLEAGDKCLGLFYMGYPKGEWPRSHRKPLEYVTEWVTE